MVTEADWTGVLTGSRGNNHDVVLAALETNIGPQGGGSQPILGIGKDGNRYWLKLRQSGQGDRVPITEQIVGRAGALIGAPTCSVHLIQVTPDHVGIPVSGGRVLDVGIEHASHDIAGAGFFGGDGVERGRDDNSRRMVGWFALYDWCWGGDVQGLFDPHDDRRFFSHDHGWYLPPEGASWSIAELVGAVDLSHEAPFNTGGCDASVVSDFADRLRGIQRGQLSDILSRIPADWNTTDEELETVGYFLERRAPAVADRLLVRFGVQP